MFSNLSCNIFMYAFVVTYDISYVWKTKSETEKEADHLT